MCPFLQPLFTISGVCVCVCVCLPWLVCVQKLSAARQEGSRRTVRKADVIYTTDRETGEQVGYMACLAVIIAYADCG